MKTNLYRGLLVLAIAAVFAVLVWRFAPDNFFYPGLGLALLATVGLAFVIYRFPRSHSRGTPAQNNQSQLTDKSQISEHPEQSDEVSLESGLRETGTGSLRSQSPKIERPPATEVAANYFRMAALAKAKEEESNTWKPKPTTIEAGAKPAALEAAAAAEPVSSENLSAGSPLPETMQESTFHSESSDLSAPSGPFISDETTLTDDDKRQLENAVWYRCENPYCKHTHFLDVHHIIDEKDGGTNKLDNLIVLCPFCHDLAHKNEIPEKEMRLWISQRQERFKLKLE